MTLTVVRSPAEWTAQLSGQGRAAVSVGNFDGLHLGHQEILRQVVQTARANGHLSAVVTFDPHPTRILRPERAPRMIQTIAQRLSGFEAIGINAALVLKFDDGMSRLSPEEFVKNILVDRMGVAAVFVGANFSFGHRGAGTVKLLAELGKQNDFEVEVVSPVKVADRVVSSTEIRSDISAGAVAEAVPLLGRPFALTGEIRTGAARGRTILFPTLNLSPEQELLPRIGVYATESIVGGRAHRSVTNVGMRPTFGGQSLSVESHLFGFSEEMTSGPMEVRFKTRLRDEQKFSGPDELRAQIARDISAALEFFAGALKLRR